MSSAASLVFPAPELCVELVEVLLGFHHCPTSFAWLWFLPFPDACWLSEHFPVSLLHPILRLHLLLEQMQYTTNFIHDLGPFLKDLKDILFRRTETFVSLKSYKYFCFVICFLFLVAALCFLNISDADANLSIFFPFIFKFMAFVFCPLPRKAFLG